MSSTYGRNACAVFTTYDPAGYCFPPTEKAAVARCTAMFDLRSACTNFVAVPKSADRPFPLGRLDDSQRHKVRLWTPYLLDMGRFGALDLSGMLRLNSGLSYSLRANGEALSDIQLARAAAAGYANEPNGGTQTIYFGERGSETFEGFAVADFHVGYNVPVFRSVRPYVKFELLNAFNNQKLTSFDTTVAANWDGPLDSLGLPTTFIKGPRFGQASRNGDFPGWRTGQAGGRAVVGAVGLRV